MGPIPRLTRDVKVPLGVCRRCSKDDGLLQMKGSWGFLGLGFDRMAHPRREGATRRLRPHVQPRGADYTLQRALRDHERRAAGPLLRRLEQQHHRAGQLRLARLQDPGGCAVGFRV